MLVGNDIRNDTRVLKSALALSDGGIEVTVLGYASGGVREETTLGRVRIIRVPVAWQMQDHAKRRGQDLRRSRVHVAVEPSVRMLQDIRATLRQREAAELGGLARRRRVNIAAVRSEVNRVRAGINRRLSRLEKLGWRAFDKARNSTGVGAEWRRLLPEMDDYELAFAPAIDRLEWDVLHAHDVHMVGIARRAATAGPRSRGYLGLRRSRVCRGAVSVRLENMSQGSRLPIAGEGVHPIGCRRPDRHRPVGHRASASL